MGGSGLWEETLWGWAQAAYGRADVAKACLELQDEYGQNVCLLLWAAWSGTLAPEPLAAAAALARRWDAAATGPLRRARRALKTPAPPIADAEREALREEIKAVELAAERLLLEGLERIGPPSRRPAPLAALRAAAAAWGGSAPEPALNALARALR